MLMIHAIDLSRKLYVKNEKRLLTKHTLCHIDFDSYEDAFCFIKLSGTVHYS